MAIGCDCNVGLSDTGRPGCVPLFSVTNNLIQVPLRDKQGNLNRLDLNAPIPTDWSVFINEADSSKRWFPIPTFENVELPKADSQFEEANSGRMAFLRQGKRSFSGELWADDSTPTFLGKLEKGRCVDFGVYIVDVNGNLIGSEVDGFLYPIPVDNASWNPTFMFATDSTVQKIMLTFDFDRNFDESTMYMITVDEAGVDFSTLKGLIDVTLSFVGTPGATSLVVDAEFCYGTAYNKLKYTGADLIADWVLTNTTLATTVTIDTVIENPDGTYTISYSAGVTAPEAIKLTVAKTGFDGEASSVTA
jgi:hypothetical protein